MNINAMSAVTTQTLQTQVLRHVLMPYQDDEVDENDIGRPQGTPFTYRSVPYVDYPADNSQPPMVPDKPVTGAAPEPPIDPW